MISPKHIQAVDAKIVAHGTVKATGQRFFLVNGSHGTQYTVLVYIGRLACDCFAGQHGRICKHRMLVHQALVDEVSKGRSEEYS